MTSSLVQLFAELRTSSIPALWPWQEEVLRDYGLQPGDAAVELPTGTGKTLIALLIAEQHRRDTNNPVAYLAGTKQLAQQVARQARDLGVPAVRFQGSKDSWNPSDIRAFNFGDAVGVMNYWNYFNASPGVEPANLLILDDVHLVEGTIRDFFTVTIPAQTDLYRELLARIVAKCPYYTLPADLLNGVESPLPPEMLAFPDTLDLAPEFRDLLDASLDIGAPNWWSWQQIRERLSACCFLVSRRAATISPFIPPSQTLDYFVRPLRRLYLSATVGGESDLRRRLGAPPFVKLTAAVQPQQGERFIILGDSLVPEEPSELVELLRPVLEARRKALWLCARRKTADSLEVALKDAGLPGDVYRLEGENGADEPFSEASDGHLVTAGRYDGLDFPGESCQLEILPETPVATSELEEWASAYLRDATFADERFAQRIIQALGRCNRTETDRSVYILADPEFVSMLSRRSIIDQLPLQVRAEIKAALRRSDDDFWLAIGQSTAFLEGEDFGSAADRALPQAQSDLGDAGAEVDGFHALWRMDHGLAADLFDRAASAAQLAPEYRAFWLAMRSLALQEAARFGDKRSAPAAITALRAAATSGASSTFFVRLRLAEKRQAGEHAVIDEEVPNNLVVSWDALIAKHGTAGPRFDRWAEALVGEIAGENHDAVARAIARIGQDLLGLATKVPRPIAGNHDAEWELTRPHRALSFEVKLAPVTKRVVNADIEQAEGAARALSENMEVPVRGFLVTPWEEIDESAAKRLDSVRLLTVAQLTDYVRSLLALVREYREGWAPESRIRRERRAALDGRWPDPDALWKAHESSDRWVGVTSIQ
jgi:hypothetical protein